DDEDERIAGLRVAYCSPNLLFNWWTYSHTDYCRLFRRKFTGGNIVMWETIKDTLAQLFDRVGVLLILLGVILFILGAAGGVGYNAVLAIKDPRAQYALEIVGSILLAIGIFVSVRIPASEPDGAKIG